MRESTQEAPILIQGSGRVNFPHFLRASDNCSSGLVPAISAMCRQCRCCPLLFLSVTNTGGKSGDRQAVPWLDDPIGTHREDKEGRWRGSV
jgi:hypothetical protein